MTGTIHRICNEEEGMYGELGSHQRAAVCLLLVFSLSVLWMDHPVQASATGCMAADIRLYDAGSGKAIENEKIYKELKAGLYEDGTLLAMVSPLSPDIISKFHYTRLILGNDTTYPVDGVRFKLGSRYRFKLIIPEGYVLDRFRIYDTQGSLPEGYKISGDSVLFTYDEEIQEQVKRSGEGGGFSASYYLKNVSAANGPLTTDIRLAKTDYKLVCGAKAFDLNAKVMNGAAPTYRSDDPSVISVDKKGKIKVKKPGKATVTISSKASGQYGGGTKKKTITVAPKKNTAVRAKRPGKKKKKKTGEKKPYAAG